MKTDDLPLAARGLISYRCSGPYGWTMIGTRDDTDTLNEARRSSKEASLEGLQVWDGARYVPVPLSLADRVSNT